MPGMEIRLIYWDYLFSEEDDWYETLTWDDIPY